MRKQRARDRELLYSRDDWQLFLDLVTLPQKAGRALTASASSAEA
jgi:hypothetical protein